MYSSQRKHLLLNSSVQHQTEHWTQSMVIQFFTKHVNCMWQLVWKMVREANVPEKKHLSIACIKYNQT